MKLFSSSKEEYQKLVQLEQKLVNSDLTLNQMVAKELYDRSIRFSEKYPKNKHREQVLVFAAKSADGLNWNQKNLAVINQLLTLFPNSPNAPNYLYNKGKIYEEKLHQKEKAIEIYQTLILKYPQSKIAKNLKDYIVFLKKTEKEQLEFLAPKE